MNVTVIPFVAGVLGTVLKSGKNLGEIENQKYQHHPNNSIV